MDVDDIARSMDKKDSRQRLTISQATDLLSDMVSKASLESVLIPALALENGISDFSDGVSSLGSVKERAEALVEAADGVLSLVSGIVNTPEVERSEFYGHAVTLMRDNRYKEATYRLAEAVNNWKYNHLADEALLDAAKTLAMYAHAAFRNVSIFEGNVGSHYKLMHIHKDESPAVVIYDKALFESVTTGGIAIRPVALGSPKKTSSEVTSRKKDRWYLRYVIER